MIAFPHHPPPPKKRIKIKIEQNITKPKLCYFFYLVVYIPIFVQWYLKPFYLSGVAAKSAVQMDKSSSQTAEKKQKKGQNQHGEIGFNLYTQI